MDTCPARAQSEGRPRLVRWAFAAAGVGCVGIGGLGVFVPGLPTTIFLIAACWLFARSCPWLERRLIRESRIFRPFLRYLEPGTRMPLRARIITLLIMWTAVTISVVSLMSSPEISAVWPIVIVASAAVGSFFVLRFRAKIPATEAQPAGA